jgi:hypothetical protein
MQIDKIRFKPFMEQEKQHWHTKNLCLYYEKLGHVAHKCRKKHDPHVAPTISIINPQLEESLIGNMSFFLLSLSTKRNLKMSLSTKISTILVDNDIFSTFLVNISKSKRHVFY